VAPVNWSRKAILKYFIRFKVKLVSRLKISLLKPPKVFYNSTLMRKKKFSISISEEAKRKLKTLSKTTGFSQSEILEYTIIKLLPEPQAVKSDFVESLVKFKTERILDSKKEVTRTKKIILPGEIDT
jgi:predicted DNA-binding protein